MKRYSRIRTKPNFKNEMEFKYIETGRNNGYAAGNNEGLRYAYGNGFKYGWILNNDIIVDDRDMRPGQKFADAELMGIPYRVVISDKTLANGEVEITDRKTGESKMIKLDELRKEMK